MNKKYNFDRQQIEQSAAESDSRTGMMRILGIRQGGGGYQALDYWCRKYDVAPPDGKLLGRSNVINHSWTAMPDDDWFVENIRRAGQLSRKRLVASGMLDICDECEQGPVWNSKPLVLQLDHINGDRWDNRKENLRILCPHCHTQTPTFANTGRRKARFYCECGAEINKVSKYCKPCAAVKTPSRKGVVVNWPPVEEIVKQVRLTNWSKTAKMYNVTDNAVRKYLIRNGIDIKNI